MATRQAKSHGEKTAPNSHVNYRYLTSPEKADRLHHMHDLLRKTRQQVQRLSLKIEKIIHEKGVELDDSTHNDLLHMMKESSSRIDVTYSDDSFQKIFWKQQMKAATLGNPRSVRWHPLMIKWCLYLRHLSGKAYEHFRESGCIVLPSQRTLRDYTYHVHSTTGFSAEEDKQLMSAAKVEQSTEEWKKCVVLVMDEMYLKEDLFYDKHSGALVGFANLGETNEHLLKFHREIESSKDATDETQPLAKTMLVFMVRGVFINLQYPYAQFPCAQVSGELLFDPFWEAIWRLERMGLKVLAATADGASTNRRLMKIHHNRGDDMTHKVINPYAPESEKRFLYFISDPPHLIKTVRNAWASGKRQLWVSMRFR